MTAPLQHAGATGLEGHYAGIVTRAASFVVDVLTIAVLYSLGGHVFEYILSVVLRQPVELSETFLASKVALVVWAFIYCAYPLAVSGRTFGMAVLGIRAVRLDGGDLDRRHAIIRVLVFPLSFLVLCFGFALIVLRRDRRALHDLIAHSAVVYSWDARAARLRFLARR